MGCLTLYRSLGPQSRAGPSEPRSGSCGQPDGSRPLKLNIKTLLPRSAHYYDLPVFNFGNFVSTYVVARLRCQDGWPSCWSQSDRMYVLCLRERRHVAPTGWICVCQWFSRLKLDCSYTNKWTLYIMSIYIK